MNDQEKPRPGSRGNYAIGAVVTILLFLLVGIINYARSQNPPSGAICPEPVDSITGEVGDDNAPDTSQPVDAQEPTPPDNQAAEPVQTTPPPEGALPRFVDLGTTTCRPCQMMIPVMDELRAEYAGKLQVDFINVSTDRAAAQQYNVTSIPLQIFFDPSGRELFRHVGYWSKDAIVNKWKQLGFEFE